MQRVQQQNKEFSIFDRPAKPGPELDTFDLDDRLPFLSRRYSEEEEREICLELDDMKIGADQEPEDSEPSLLRIEELLGFGDGGTPHPSPLVRAKAVGVLAVLGKSGGRASRRRRAIMNAQELLVDPEDAVCAAASQALLALEAQVVTLISRDQYALLR